MYSVLLAALMVALGTPPGQQQKAQPPAAAKGTIEGVVLKAETREPLRKAWVYLWRAAGRAPTQSVMTDTSGRFVFKDIEPGKYSLRADRNGFVPQAYGQRTREGEGTVLTVSAGQTMRDIEICLTPAAAISGHVYDEDGEPVAYARVAALRFSYEEGKRKLDPTGESWTNDLGEYRIFALAPGRYYLSATFAAGHPPVAATAAESGDSGGASETAYAPTYFPGVNDLARAATLEVRTGDDLAGLDITLQSTRAVRVRGRILSVTTGKATSHGVMVALQPRDLGVRSYYPSAQTYVEDPEGSFELRGVVPGAYVLSAVASDGERRFHARLPLDVGASDIDGLIVPLGTAIDIPGRLQWEGPPANKENAAHVALEPREQSIFGGGGWSVVTPDGKFALKNVADGDYRLRVLDAEEDCYLKSARWGGEDVLEDGLSIASGKIPGPLEIVLNCAGGTLEGVVLDEQGRPAAEARVVLVPEGERRSQPHLFKSATPDQYGHFVMKGIAPGDYKLFAWEEVESGAYLDPEFLKRYEEKGKSVTMGENSKQTVQLQLIPAEKTGP